MMARIGLLVVGHVDTKSVHVAGDYPELFRSLLEPLDLDIVSYAVDEGHMPASLDECDGWIMSPSRLSVYDEIAWLGDVEQLVREAVARDYPFVGICFGHQLLAQVLGGTVERCPDGWGVGVRDYVVTERLACMDPPLEELALIASHQDQVVAVPGGARVIASSAYCPVAGLAVGERVWSLQGHPEFVPDLAEHLLAGRVELIGAETVGTARASLTRPTDRHLVARWIAKTVGGAV